MSQSQSLFYRIQTNNGPQCQPKNIDNKINSQLFMRSKDYHSNLDKICIDSRCGNKQFLPICSTCEEISAHNYSNHQTKPIKMILKDLLEEIELIRWQKEGKQEEIKKNYQNIVSEFELIQQMCQAIIDRIKTYQNATGNEAPIGKVREIIEKILDSSDSQSYNLGFLELKNFISFTKSQIKIGINIEQLTELHNNIQNQGLAQAVQVLSQKVSAQGMVNKETENENQKSNTDQSSFFNTFKQRHKQSKSFLDQDISQLAQGKKTINYSEHIRSVIIEETPQKQEIYKEKFKSFQIQMDQDQDKYFIEQLEPVKEIDQKPVLKEEVKKAEITPKQPEISPIKSNNQISASKDKISQKEESGTKKTIKIENIKQNTLETIKDFVEVDKLDQLDQFSQPNQINNLQLNLEDVGLGNEGMFHLQKSLLKYEKITKLDMNFTQNSIGNEEMKIIKEILLKMPELKSLILNFADNEIKGDGISHFGESLKCLKNLSQLEINLEGNKIKEQGARYLGEALLELSNIKKIDINLWENKIGSAGVDYLTKGIGNNKSLTCITLGLENNKLGNSGLMAMSNNLKDLHNLQQIDFGLADNLVGLEGIESLSQSLKELQKIKKLSIYFLENNIGSQGIVELQKALEKLDNLEQIDLSIGKNNIDIGVIENLTTTLYTLPALKKVELYIQDNNFKELPQSLQSLKQDWKVYM